MYTSYVYVNTLLERVSSNKYIGMEEISLFEKLCYWSSPTSNGDDLGIDRFLKPKNIFRAPRQFFLFGVSPIFCFEDFTPSAGVVSLGHAPPRNSRQQAGRFASPCDPYQQQLHLHSSSNVSGGVKKHVACTQFSSRRHLPIYLCRAPGPSALPAKSQPNTGTMRYSEHTATGLRGGGRFVLGESVCRLLCGKK